MTQKLPISDMQDAIQKAGWQWRERVFNDGGENDCLLDLTQSTDPLCYIGTQESWQEARKGGGVGWGRFTRLFCWERAYEWCVLGKRP